MQYPRLLIITSEDAYTTQSSASFTIRSFLKNWPSDSIFQIVCGDFNLGKEGLVRNDSFVLGHKSIRVASWIIKADRIGKSALSTGQVRNLYVRDSLKTVVMNFAKGIYQLLPYKVPSTLEEALKDFRPDISYSSVVDYRGIVFTNYISKKFAIPAMPHFMDDWPTIYLNSRGQGWQKKVFEKQLEHLFETSPYYFCICDYMSEAYKKRYGNPNAVSLMNSVTSHTTTKSKKENSSKRWLYAGSLYLKRYDSLIRVADALTKLGRVEDTIVVFCPKNQWEEMSPSFQDYPQIEYGGFISQEELLYNIVNVDYLLFIETFDEEMLSFTRYSMSTKIPEYLSSGNPIIAVGNLEQGSIRYLVDNKAAYVATSSDMIQEEISALVNGKDNQEILNNAHQLFAKNHTQEAQISKFAGIVNSVLQK